MSMITAVSWVPRGHAAQFPTKYVFDEEEYERISKLAKLELDDAREDLEEAKAAAKVSDQNGMDVDTDKKTKKSKDESKADQDSDVDINDDDLKEYDLEHYDDSPDEDADEDGPATSLPMFGNARSLAYHSSNAEDPYITLKDDDASDNEEREEMQVLATDNLVLAAKVEDEVAHLEVYVYEDSDDNLYVHHDIMLPAIPLAVEWINMPVNRKVDAAGATNDKANFVAIGTLDPEIEIWDLDLVDSMYPNAVLGAPDATPSVPSALAPPKKKKKKSKQPNSTHHVDSVLSLASSRSHPNLLASASADTTVKLWDLSTLTCAQSYTHHTDKVSSIAWHPTTTTALLSGSYDRTLVAADMRAPTTTPSRWGVESDIETLAWDPHDTNLFYAATESGILHCFDARNAPSKPEQSKPLWRLQAHESSLGTFALNPVVPGFVATGSSDHTVKLWDTRPGASAGPSMVVSRDLDVGRVFGVSFAPDPEVGFRLAVAGSKGNLQVWDTSTNRAVREAFATRVAGGIAERKGGERMVKVAEDSEDEDDDEGEGEGQGDGKDG
ncbi:WD40 repeat-like protein [Myriangium duriaei CBS 260.36]|uniref:WD40 repeat-like protein n=1 Tax=Myriangium duriaei CBS 260.36 TaxID=1168546 RepID=A0A9P4J9G9_9PEZI|nr:WD40 repeat-like protein [Myriangium duriaei CBS 260.36]